MNVGYKNEQGAITIYLLLIMVAMIFFIGLLIDVTRVLAAKKAVLKAANASAMSVLADYNPDLRSYGLYGLRDASSANDQFNQYLTENLAKNGLFDYEVESTSNYGDMLTASSLLDHDVLRQEILQEMKYRAPIELTTQLVEAFSSMGKMAGKFDKASKMEDNGKQKSRNDKMNSATKNVKKKFPKDSPDESDLTKKTNVFKDTWSGLQIKKDEDLAKEDLSSLLKSIDSTDGVLAYTTSIQTYVQDHVKTMLTEALDEDADIEEELDSPADPRYPNASLTQIDNPKNIQEHDYKTDFLEKETLNKGIKVIDKYVTKLKLVNSEIDALKTAVDKKNIQEIRNIAEKLDADIQELKSMEGKELAEFDVSPKSQKTEVVYEKGETGDYAKKSKANVTKDPDGIFNKLENEFKLKADLKSAVKYFVDKNNAINATYENPFEEDHKGVWKFIMNLFDQLKNIGYSSRDTLFINEFALSKFTSFTQENPADPANDPVKSHVLKSSETEYVIYGNGSPILDLSAAFAELYAVRTAINTLYYFTYQPNPDPTMLTRLVSSAAAGAILAIADVAEITIAKKEVRLMGQWGPFGSYGPMLDYNDYLRLFMLLQTNNESVKLARIQSIISLNAEDSHLNPPTMLEKSPSVVSFDAKVSIRLWFIPMIAKEVLKFGGFEVQGDRVILEQQVTASY